MRFAQALSGSTTLAYVLLEMSVFLYLAKRATMLMFQDGHDFEWIRGETLFSSWKWPVGGALVYLVVIALCKHFIAKPIKVPKKLLSLHNLVLCIGSAIMFVGCLSSVIQVCPLSASRATHHRMHHSSDS